MSAGEWVGGIVGVKSILGTRSKQAAESALSCLEALGYLSYDIELKTKRLAYQISDWVHAVDPNPAREAQSAYPYGGCGFLCVPRDLTQRLAENGMIFDELDAWLDLWCHTVWNDPCNTFSSIAPVIQMRGDEIALTLDKLGVRWKWEKTKVWRFFQNYKDTFSLIKLPGSQGCTVVNMTYDDERSYDITAIAEKFAQILDEIRIIVPNAYIAGSDHDRVNQLLLRYSRIQFHMTVHGSAETSENRVALFTPITRAYPSPALIEYLYSVQETKMRKLSAGFVEMLTSRGLLEDKTIQNEDIRKANQQRKRAMHHNTFQLLKHYRDISWAIQSVPQDMIGELDSPMIEVDALVNLIGMELETENRRLEGRLLSLRKSRLMLDTLHQAVDRLRSKPNNGELMYQILHRSFLQSEIMELQEILDTLGVSQRHYYRLRRQAIQLLSILLWSSPDRDLDGWLDVLVLLEEQ